MASEGTSTADNIAVRANAWQQRADKQYEKPAPLAFSGRHYQHLGRHEGDANYGRPLAGSKTELRGKQAGIHISTEVVELCSIIRLLGVAQPDGSYAVTFGDLFEFYTRISNKLVGMLMRARRQGLVSFDGEMLYQRRDDHVVIRLIKSPDELEADVEQQRTDLRVTQPSSRRN